MSGADNPKKRPVNPALGREMTMRFLRSKVLPIVIEPAEVPPALPDPLVDNEDESDASCATWILPEDGLHQAFKRLKESMVPGEFVQMLTQMVPPKSEGEK